MIVELYGLPGSGKSTLVSSFCDIKLDYKKYGTNTFIGNSKFNKFKYGILCLKPQNFLTLILLIFSVAGKKSSFKIKMKDRIISLLYVIYILDIVQTKNEKFILDEGLVQALSAFYIGFNFRENVLYHIKKLINKQNYVFCYCDISYEESLSRMHSRNRKSANIDFMDRTELLLFMEELSNKNRLIASILSKDFSHLRIDMSNPKEAFTDLDNM